MDNIESLAVIPNTSEVFDETWMIVNRDGGRFIERMVKRLGSKETLELADQIFVDSALTYSGSATDTFTGLEHLEGETVAVLADGIVQSATEVISGGLVTIATSASKVTIGLPYDSDIETLNIELGDDGQTLQGRRVKVGNINIKFEQSRGGFIGPDEDTLYQAFTSDRINQYEGTVDTHDDTALSTETSLYTGTMRAPLGSGYKDGGRMYFRQDDPLPVTISSITPEIDIGDATG